MSPCKTCGTICQFYIEDVECDNYKPKTNEDWFCQLSTEEKAKALETIIRNVLVQRPPMCHDICNREFWETWLKEKHNG